jgi:maltose alpha-D-glucosyltransferase/alpha-amylase
VLCDALIRESTCQALLSLISQQDTLQCEHGVLRGIPSSMLAQLTDENAKLSARRSSAEQSNTSILFEDRLIMKCFRRQEFGPNPDTEIARFLTERTQFRQTAPFGGSIEYVPSDKPSATLAMLQGLVANEGDGWEWTLEELERYFESCATANPPAESLGDARYAAVAEHAGLYLEAASTLGRRTAEMHLALASCDDVEDFRPESVNASDLETLSWNLAEHATRSMELLKANLSHLSDNAIEMGALVMSQRRDIAGRFKRLTGVKSKLVRTRVHGDYHLGQVLRARADFVILDFEGEPARSLTERRQKQLPLKDVAGMLRSFHYAAFSALAKHTTRRPEDYQRMEPWATSWVSAVGEIFLRTYREVAGASPMIPADASDFQVVLDAYLLDKALYELGYELNNRPDWVHIPLSGILSLLS